MSSEYNKPDLGDSVYYDSIMENHSSVISTAIPFMRQGTAMLQPRQFMSSECVRPYFTNQGSSAQQFDNSLTIQSAQTNRYTVSANSNANVGVLMENYQNYPHSSNTGLQFHYNNHLLQRADSQKNSGGHSLTMQNNTVTSYTATDIPPGNGNTELRQTSIERPSSSLNRNSISVASNQIACLANVQSHGSPEKVSVDATVWTEHTKKTPEISVKANTRKRREVLFFLKGKLGPDIYKFVKSVQETLIEPVDFEQNFFDNFVYSYPAGGMWNYKDEAKVGNNNKVTENNTTDSIILYSTNKKAENVQNFQKQGCCVDGISSFSRKNENTRRESSSLPAENPVMSNVATHINYMEPSLAQIRASVLDAERRIKDELGDTTLKKQAEDSEVSEIKEEYVDEMDDSDVANESWYAALKTYMDTPSKFETQEYSTSAIKGGRSDPDNPFAITSPSFSDSTAKAVLTTLQSSNATIVMISVMSIGSREQLIPKIVNSKAAVGGIVSIANPMESPKNKKTQTDQTDKRLESQKTSIMSKLQRVRTHSESSSKDGTNSKDSKIDRLDINIRIEDRQYVGTGDNKRWLCKLCEKSYTTKHNLVTHILDHTGIKPHLCLVCGKYFKQLSHLNVHMLTHDNVRPHVCPICNKGFTQVSHLKRHETVHSGSKPYVCDICSRGFAFPSELRIHKDKHTLGGEKCMECDAEFSTPQELQEHMVTKNHVQDLTCKHCSRVFRFPSLLRDHMATHEGVRPYICTECGMDFLKEHHLKSHLFTHTGVRPYQCPECGRAFNQKANMHRHMLIHNAQRAYKCEVCSKTFTQPQTLKAHMIVHSAKKPYKCTFCSKEFSRRHNLQGHMHVHNNSRPFKCSICQSSFTLKGNLNRHKKVKHGLDETTENMEVDAVKFLSTMSDRARHFNSDLDTDDSNSPGKSNKKGRKSIPKKRVNKAFEVDSEPDCSMDADNLISYSDEERENERLLDQNSDGINESYDGDENNITDVDETMEGVHVSRQSDPGKKCSSDKTVGVSSGKKRKYEELEGDVPEDPDDDVSEDVSPQPKIRCGVKLSSIIASKFA